jgi:asparagine synthetase A
VIAKETLRRQLELTGQLDFLELPYHRAILEDRIPLSIGGGIGQSRVAMLRLRKAYLGEVSVTVWPDVLRRWAPRGTSTSSSEALGVRRVGHQWAACLAQRPSWTT